MKQFFRNICLAAIVLFFSYTALAQNPIPNPSFENWGTADPDSWVTSNIPVTGPANVTQTPDAQHGSFAARGEVVDFSGFPYPPWLQAGTISGGFPVSQNYSTLTGYYKFSPVGNDTMTVVVALIDSTGGGGSGGGVIQITNPVSSYTQFTINIEYSDPGPVNQAFIAIAIAGEFNIHVGSWFQVDNMEFSGVSAIGDDENLLPDQFALRQNYPNPFNPTTTISYYLPKAENVELSIYNMSGQKVKTLMNEMQPAGEGQINWDGRNDNGDLTTSGMYLYRLRAGSKVFTRKMILLR